MPFASASIASESNGASSSALPWHEAQTASSTEVFVNFFGILLVDVVPSCTLCRTASSEWQVTHAAPLFSCVEASKEDVSDDSFLSLWHVEHSASGLHSTSTNGAESASSSLELPLWGAQPATKLSMNIDSAIEQTRLNGIFRFKMLIFVNTTPELIRLMPYPRPLCRTRRKETEIRCTRRKRSLLHSMLSHTGP